MKHTHTYRRVKNRPNYYQCIHPDCSHYIHKDLILNKRAICPLCGQEYILESRLIRLKQPHCFDCSRSVKPKQVIDMKKLTERLEKALQ
jgi:hypothetical protein